MRPIPLALAMLALTTSGCGQAAYESAGEVAGLAEAPSADFSYKPTPPTAAGPGTAPAEAPGMEAGMAGMIGPAVAPGPAQDAPPAGAEPVRKIIYDAQIELVVEDLDPAADRLVELVGSRGGYIAEQDLSGAPGSRRSGRWKLRVPVEQFEGLVRDLLALGELQRNQRTSQDVTEQFYDIEARVRNKRVEEQTLLEILDERSGKLEDVLKVEVELSRVRGEIEQLEGRLRVLESLSSLATVTLRLREREDYDPAAPVAPDFGTRIARAWSSSVEDLQTLGENLVIFAVGLAPWLPLILVAVVAALFLLRRLARALPRPWVPRRQPIGPPPPSP